MPSRDDDRRGLGRWGEELAVARLSALGYVVLARNYRSAHTLGEADIIARDGEVLVVAEVKTRRSASFGTPAESITPRKAERLLALLDAYRLDHPEAPPGSRVDLVGVTVRRGAAPTVEVIRNAVERVGFG